MTANRITVAMEKYAKEIPPDKREVLARRLKDVGDESMDKLMTLPIKKRITTLLLAIFLGGIGAQRFYIGDRKMGVYRILASVAVSFFSFLVPLDITWQVVYILVSLASFGWIVAECFLSYKAVKQKNFLLLAEFSAIHSIGRKV